MSLAHARVAVVSQESLEQLAPHIASQLAGHWRVDDVTNTEQLDGAVRALANRYGTIHRCFGAFEQLQVPLAVVRERLGIEGLSSAAAVNFRDKARMKDVLREAGVPVARHALVASLAEAEAFVGAVGYPVVMKPPAGAGARATYRVDHAAALREVIAQHQPSTHTPMLAEEFLRGTEHSLETISINGEAIWHSLTHYLPPPLHVLENSWIQWSVLLPRNIDDTRFDDIRAVGSRALRALGMDTGVTHCEWFRRPDGSLAISEIAARPPGAQITTMIARANDVDFVGAWVRLMVDGTFDAPTRRYAVGTAYLRGQGSGRVVGVNGFDVVEQEFGAMICDVKLPTRGQVPTGSYEGEGFIMLRHEDTDVVMRALKRVVSVVHVQLN